MTTPTPITPERVTPEDCHPRCTGQHEFIAGEVACVLHPEPASHHPRGYTPKGGPR